MTHDAFSPDGGIYQMLCGLADEKFRQFTSSLLPGTENILGVRLPVLRRIARRIAKRNWRSFLEDTDVRCFEQIMLRGMVIGYADAPAYEIFSFAAKFVPEIDNWSVCDSFCSGLKIAAVNRTETWEFLRPYFFSAEEFAVRFAVVMLLNYYVTDDYIDRVFDTLDRVRHEGYYVKMAVAWAVSLCYIKLPERTEPYLRRNFLDDFTHNKALQKICDSHAVAAEAKARVRVLKRGAAFSLRTAQKRPVCGSRDST